MITLITGAPGSGKSAAMLQMLLELGKDRPLFCNGIPDLALPHVELEDPHQWPTECPDGALVVIDEAQRIWRPMGAGQRLPDSIAQLETHRHRGIDFIVITQHPKLIHSNVRNLVGRHVHIRDLGILGRRWYEWPEAAEPAQHRTAPHSRRYKLPKEVFKLYKSSSLHVKPVREIPRAMWILVLCGLLLAGAAWRVVASVGGKIDDAKKGAFQAAATPAKVSDTPKEKGTQTGAAQPTVAAAPPPAASSPSVAGCVSSDKLCKCFGRDGFPVIVEWHLCRTSASTFAGVVPLSVNPSPTSANTPPAALPRAEAPQPPAHIAINAGDIRTSVAAQSVRSVIY